MNSDLPSATCPSFDILRRQLTMVDATAKFYSGAFDQTSEAMMVIDDSGRVLIEVHLLDWHGDAYGKLVRVEFLKKLRD